MAEWEIGGEKWKPRMVNYLKSENNKHSEKLKTQRIKIQNSEKTNKTGKVRKVKEK